jgi:hypothetical protein
MAYYGGKREQEEEGQEKMGDFAPEALPAPFISKYFACQSTILWSMFF